MRKKIENNKFTRIIRGLHLYGAKRMMPMTNKDTIEAHGLLFRFIATLTLDENFGDVADSISTVLRTLDIAIEYDDLIDLGMQLSRDYGVETLYGTILHEEESP